MPEIRFVSRRLAAFVTAASLGLVGLTITSAPAANAAWYCGDECNYEWPDTYHPSGGHAPCANDAYTAKQVTGPEGITLQLRYSPSCRTVWGRFYGGYDGVTYGLKLNRPYYENGVMYDQGRGGSWGRMLNDAGLVTRVCIFDANFTWEKACTAYY